MPLQSQFSLTMELTRLVPLGIQIAGKTYEAAMKLARDLQSSGSDIVVEEDLAEAFGRSRIADCVASSFRTAMSTLDHPEQLGQGFVLFRGPGPTVARALTEAAYFSTIVQCSFLVCVHECASLAACLAGYFEKIDEDTPPNSIRRSAPSAESIRGMLRACEDQTERCDWMKHLLAVAALLGLKDSNVFETISPTILQGLISMLPLTQHFPDDRTIVIQAPRGVCSIVAWAHILLGLSVSVRLDADSDGKEKFIRFPTNRAGIENVLIDARKHFQHEDSGEEPGFVKRAYVLGEETITLLSTATKEEIFRLSKDLDDNKIDATFKRPAKGLGSSLLDIATPPREGRERVMEEIKYISCAFALCISNFLHVARTLPPAITQSPSRPLLEKIQTSFSIHPENDMHDAMSSPVDEGLLSYPVDRKRVFDAAKFLFDVREHELPTRQIEDYESLYTKRCLYGIKDPPSCIRPIFTEWLEGLQSDGGTWWVQLRDEAILISILILAFAHVVDLDTCGDMPLCGRGHLQKQSSLNFSVSVWDGQDQLLITNHVWLEIIKLMMFGHTRNANSLSDVSLLSNRGWSVYVNTFGDEGLTDPIYLDPSCIAISRGVPWRKGVSKHSIIDGPSRLAGEEPSFITQSRKSVDFATLTCAIPAAIGKYMVGESGDSFMVTIRIHTQDSKRQGKYKVEGIDSIRRTGFNELWRARSGARETRSCRHPQQFGGSLKLEPGWDTLFGLGHIEIQCSSGTLRIFETAGDTVARWRTLLDVVWNDGVKERILIRTPDCCLSCAVSQASSGKGRCWLIL